MKALRVLLYIVLIAISVVCGLALAVFTISPLGELPETESILQTELSEPLRIYTVDDKLIGVYGNERRIPITIDQAPQMLINAILAAEDNGFYDHSGVDFMGIGRAMLANLQKGGHSQGASTITMQVARNFFLTPEKTYTRKLKEILLSFKLERELSKDEILSLYLNKIFLGQRSYGFAAASQIYYGKPLNDLTIAENAMLAGLPKAPSSNNPISNPNRAVQRRNYILRSMHGLGFITQEQMKTESEAPLTASLHIAKIDVDAPYAAEMARQYMYNTYGKDAYEKGLTVHTTVRSEYQTAADGALRKGLIGYDRRHGYRGRVKQLSLANNDLERLDAELSKLDRSKNLIPGVATEVGKKSMRVYVGENKLVDVSLKGTTWAGKYISPTNKGSTPNAVNEVVKKGDVVYVVQEDDESWWLAQIPKIEGALVSLDPNSGAILALSGGFDYYLSKYNRAIQAERQPGSNLKPFIYSAALDNGFTPATLVSGAPIVIDDATQGVWRPENYSGKVFGPTRLRKALSLSLNLVSVRMLRAVGVGVALKHLEKFGFDPKKLPNNLTLALGSANVTPIQMAAGYAVLANGGFRVQPYYIDRIVDRSGGLIAESETSTFCEVCDAPRPDEFISALAERYTPRTIDAHNAFLMASMMQDVISAGTATRAKALNRGDLSGKTGTTNSFRDAWFTGFNSDIVTSVWTGFDDSSKLGRESGARAALPIWIDYMRVALKDKPEKPPQPPAGITTAWVNVDTGLRASEGDPNAYVEYFAADSAPAQDERVFPNRQRNTRANTQVIGGDSYPVQIGRTRAPVTASGAVSETLF